MKFGRMKEHGWFVEYAVITFVGGGQSHISVNGNSILAIFQEIADKIMGGYYKEEFTYRDLPKDGLRNSNFKERAMEEKYPIKPSGLSIIILLRQSESLEFVICGGGDEYLKLLYPELRQRRHPKY